MQPVPVEVLKLVIHVGCGMHIGNLVAHAWCATSKSKDFPAHLLMVPMPNAEQRGNPDANARRDLDFFLFLVAAVYGHIALEDKGVCQTMCAFAV